MLSLFISIFLLHPLHLSTTEIEYSKKKRALQIVSRIFIDDLESAIRNARHQEALNILNPKHGLSTKKIIGGYLKRHFRIKIDGTPCQINFIGYEEEDFALVCYLEIENVNMFTTIEIVNTVIMEIYEDQSNIVHIMYEGRLKSFRLVHNNSSAALTF